MKPLNKRDSETLVEYTLNLGRQMMECGAEAWRAENTMARIFRAYEMEVLDAHAMPTQVAATVKGKDGAHYPSTCMVLPEKTGMNLRRLEQINTAARMICFDPPPVDQLPTIVDNSPHWVPSELLGYILGIGAFAVFFGGNLLDGILSALIGCGGLDAFREMLPTALENGVTPVMVKETIYQATDYIGYGRMLPFLNASNDVFVQNKIQLPLPGQATTTMADRLEKGAETQAAIFGEHMKEAWKKGHINRWLAANCFGEK